MSGYHSGPEVGRIRATSVRGSSMYLGRGDPRKFLAEISFSPGAVVSGPERDKMKLQSFRPEMNVSGTRVDIFVAQLHPNVEPNLNRSDSDTTHAVSA